MQWHVKKGDVVKQFQPLVEVQSDKATVEITSRYAGVVDELSYGEGDIARVGEPLCFIVADGDESATGSMDPVPDETETNGVNKLDSPDDDTTSASYETAAGGEKVEDAVPIAKPLATPAVRGLAQELGVSLASVRARYV